MSATVSAFGRGGITYVTSEGEGGTQRNEFEAAIKSVTSSTTVGAVFLYDTSQDSDGGKWRKKTSHTSWAREASSATRSARSEFPAMALIVADNASGAETVTIYDLDDVAAPVWMVFSNTGSLTWATSGSVIISSLHALNGRLYVGMNLGALEYDFINDHTRIGYNPAYYLSSSGIIADRNATIEAYAGGDGYQIVNATVNDVAMTVLEGSPIGELGLPIPTVAVGTAGGCSVILANGTVNNSSSSAPFTGVKFDDKGVLFIAYNASTDSWVTQCEPSVYHTAGGNFNVSYFTETAHSGATSYIPNFVGSDPKIANLANDGLAVGTDSALNLYKINKVDTTESSLATVTSTYNTGYMVGDIRGAWLARGTKGKEDRSVKGNDLTVTETAGALTSDVVATDAEMVAISNFSANRYLSKAYDASLDLGTTCTVMAWVKVDLTSTGYQTVAAYNSASRVNGWQLLVDGSEQPYFYVYGASADVTSGVASAITDTGWHFLVGVNDGAKSYIYVDGKLGNSTAGVAGSMNNGTGRLSVGVLYNDTLPWDDSLSLVRVSATASTPKQIADIYAAEKPLFAAGAKCLLSQVTHNSVNDLAYDKSSDLLYVGTTSADAGDSVSTYRGLERVDTKDGQDLGWDGASAHFVAAAGGVVGYARNGSATGSGLILDLPALDVRAELNEGESKLPDDGKLHFEGVTTNSTPTVIGSIPLAIGDRCLVNARVIGCRHDAADSGYRISADITQAFIRSEYNSNVFAEAVASKLTEIDSDAARTAGIDVDFIVSTASQTAQLRVTGSTNVPRMVWHATVEVQRISDKTYER